MKLRKQAVSMALAASLAMSLMPGMPLVPASGAEASTEETQETVKVPALTIADTYYSVNGKFPLYVQKNYDSHGGDTLTVTDADTGALIAEGIFNGTGCEISEIAGVKNGDSRRLTFVSKNDQGEETGKITKTVSFKDKAAWASREYLTQERLNEDFYLYVTEGPALSSPAAIDSLYFLDKENKVAAGAVISVTGWNYKNNDERYGDLFAYNPSSTDWKYCQIHANLINIFPTRKLVSGETLTAAYAIDGTVYPVTNTAITVTDKPYISEVSQREEYLTDYDDTFAVEVKGCNVDFSKLNFVLKAGDTIVGEPVSCLVGDNYAYYTVKWKENHQPRSDYYYDIEFDDPEIVIDEKESDILPMLFLM